MILNSQFFFQTLSNLPPVVGTTSTPVSTTTTTSTPATTLVTVTSHPLLQVVPVEEVPEPINFEEVVLTEDPPLDIHVSLSELADTMLDHAYAALEPIDNATLLPEPRSDTQSNNWWVLCDSRQIWVLVVLLLILLGLIGKEMPGSYKWLN